MIPYKAPPIRLDEIPKKENTKPELVCEERDVLWEKLMQPIAINNNRNINNKNRSRIPCLTKVVLYHKRTLQRQFTSSVLNTFKVSHKKNKTIEG